MPLRHQETRRCADPACSCQRFPVTAPAAPEVVRFFAVCQTSGVGFDRAVQAAGVIADAAAVWNDDGIWSATVAAVLGEPAFLRSMTGVSIELHGDTWQTNWSQKARHLHRLDQITTQLVKLT